jgi:hypothetical protein
MSRLSNSVSLVKSSWHVLRQDKELIALPAISGIVTAIAMLPFAAGAFLTGVSTEGSETSVSPAAYVVAFLGYLVAAYITIFFQSALILAANDRLSGGSPTLGSALSAAAGRAGHILPWAIISATVSMVLKAVQERSGLLGRLVIGLVGMAWTLVTFLVLPILVIEGTGVKDALTRSASTFKRTWGENVIGNAGVGLVGFVGILVGLLVCAPLVVLGVSSDLVALTVGAIVLFVVWAILVSVFSAALSGVFQTALYRFAVLGEEPAGFTHEQIAGAFVPRTRRF